MSENTIDQQFIEYIVKSLVGNPDAVVIERKIDEKGVLLTLTVDPEDLGRVIGKRGATAQSMRNLLRALGTKQEARFNLKIVDNGEPRERREDDRPVAKEESSSSDSESSDTPEEDKSAVDGWNSSEASDEYSSSEDGPDSEDKREETAVERTRRELEDLDDLDV